MTLSLPTRKWVYVFSIQPVRLFTLSRLMQPRQFARLLWCLYLGKVGFESQNTDRANGVEYSIRERLGLDVRVKRVIRVKVFMFRPIEKAVHNVMNSAGLHSPHLQGCSGWTEIFRVFNVVSGLLILCAAYAFLPEMSVAGLGLPVLIGLAVMFTPYPIDMALYVLLLAALEYVFYLFAWWAAWLVSGVIFGIIGL